MDWRPRRSKYNVDVSDLGEAARTRGPGEIHPSLKGTYDSLAELIRAQQLDLALRAGLIDSVDRQVVVPLTDAYTPRLDFRIVDPHGVRYEEVKGFRTRDTGILIKHWRLYGPAPLCILWYQGRGKDWKIETIEGRKQDDK